MVISTPQYSDRLEGTFRHGYRGADGAFHDLCAYGLLASEYRSP